jgi:putative ABC transport system permease protein
METLFQDLRYGIRMLLKSPGFTFIAVVSLALGISANTAIFSVVNAILLKQLPYKDPARLVLVWGAEPANDRVREQVSFTDAADWRKQSGAFEELSTFMSWSPIFSGMGDPERVPAIQVADGFFSVMGGKPLLGRVFIPEDQQDGKDFVVILSHGLWQRRFGGDPDVIGKTLSLNTKTYTVVGVMQQDFYSLPTTLIPAPAELYRPLAEKYDEEERSSRHLRAIARLKPGVSIDQAQTEMDLIAGRIEKEHPKSNTGYGVKIVSLHEDMVGKLRPALLLLFGAVGFVLLIACANIANLLLARSSARQKEIAIRAAIGASRLRLIRQSLTESVMLSLLGGAFGLLLALWEVGLVEAIGFQVTPLLGRIEMDLKVLSFTFFISLVTGLFFGLVPALQSTRPDLVEILKEGGRGSTAGRSPLRNALVVAEVAMALVLLVCAGLLIKSLILLQNVDPGFNPSNLLTMNIGLPFAKYNTEAKRSAFFRQILERIELLDGIKSAAVTSVLPISANFDRRGLEVEGKPMPPGQQPDVDLYAVTGRYLRTMEIPLQSGRDFTEQDNEKSLPVALVSETMARSLWPGEDPIGKRVKLPGSSNNIQPWRTVVGIVKDVKQYGLDSKATMQLYLLQDQLGFGYMTLVVRTESDPLYMTSTVKNQILSVDKDQAVSQITSMEQVLSNSISLRRFSMLLLGVFAALALLMATVGIYGVISYMVVQRTHEIGIRIALGAQERDVLKLIVGQGIRLAFIGLVIGLVSSLILTRLMSSLLFNVTATDSLTYISISTLLFMVALLACYIPARRATKVDPMVALRYE